MFEVFNMKKSNRGTFTTILLKITLPFSHYFFPAKYEWRGKLCSTYVIVINKVSPEILNCGVPVRIAVVLEAFGPHSPTPEKFWSLW